MDNVEVKNLGSPDEVRTFPSGKMDLLTLSGMVLGRATFEPGWKWSECVKPIAGTDLCQVHHNGIVLSGRMHIVMEDGSETDVGPGDVFVCPAGHDAWIVGDEACEVFDFSSDIGVYAKK